MNRRTSFAYLAALLTLLIGCASGPGARDTAFKLEPTQGLLYFAQTATLGKATKDSWFYIRKVGQSEQKRLAARGLLPTFLSSFNDDFPDLSGRDGRAQVMQLEPGEYELVSWTIYIQTMGGYGYVSPKAELKPVPFRIESGTATYIGRLHIETLTGKNLLGLEIPASGRPECSDHSDEDIRLIRSKYPSLARVPVTTSILNLDPWTR